MRRPRLVLATLLLAGPALCRTAIAADPADGQAVEDKRPSQALGACASGDVVKGVAILGELYAETRNPAYVFNQGRCYQKNGQLEPARHHFAEYLRIGVSEPPPDLQRARDLVKEIDDLLARQRASQPAPAVEAPAGTFRERNARALRIGSVVLAAVGVVAVGTGAYMGLKVRSTNDEINQRFADEPWVTDGAWLQRKLADGSRYETLQWVGYGVGAVSLAGAVTAFILGGSVLPWSESGSGSRSSERAALDVAPALSADSVGGVARLRF